MFSSTHKVKIDKQLYRRLTQVAERAGYASTEELIRHVLQREAAGLEEEQDRELAERQLRGLGYIE